MPVSERPATGTVAPMATNPVAAGGFSSAAGTYSTARPLFARAAIGEIKSICAGASPIADLAAGTGILTGQLARAGIAPIVVEPLLPAAVHLRSALAGVPAALGTADALPLRTGALQGCTVSDTTGWSEPRSTLAEVGRVLDDGAPLMMLFECRDESLDSVMELAELFDRHLDTRPDDSESSAAWVEVIAETGLFSDVAERRFDNTASVTVAVALDRLRSTPAVAALPATERDALVAEARDRLESRADVTGAFDLSAQTLMLVARRRR